MANFQHRPAVETRTLRYNWVSEDKCARELQKRCLYLATPTDSSHPLAGRSVPLRRYPQRRAMCSCRRRYGYCVCW